MLIQPQTKDGAIIIRKRFAFGSGFALIIYLLFRLAPFSSEEPPPGSGFLSGFFALPVRRAPTQSHPPSRRPNPRENSSLRLDTTRYIYLAAEQEKTSSAPGRSPRPSYLVPSALYPPSGPLGSCSFDQSYCLFPFSVGFCWCDVPGVVDALYLPRRVSPLAPPPSGPCPDLPRRLGRLAR